jgi:steroid Delta-isomerase
MISHDAPSRAMNAVMNKDRAGWLACFADDAILRDPVGGSPVDPDAKGLVGKEALGRFWDAVVDRGPPVRFHVRSEYTSGASVARVATVEVDLGPEQKISYEGVFVYDMDASGRIAHLHGYFEWPRTAG